MNGFKQRYGNLVVLVGVSLIAIWLDWWRTEAGVIDHYVCMV